MFISYNILWEKVKGEQVFNLFPLIRLLNNVLDIIEYIMGTLTNNGTLF